MNDTPLPPLRPGTLYLVATPIGNLEDITMRALRVLRECDVVAAEDTRHSGRLLQHFGISKPMLSYFQFNEARRSEQILERLRRGEKVALVTDAGSPGISDPGARVVAAALAAGLRVEAVPGPCALVAALTASGLPAEAQKRPAPAGIGGPANRPRDVGFLRIALPDCQIAGGVGRLVSLA
jgi:16S rRNA (cytidine1402-2'-O)-methyltransferase